MTPKIPVNQQVNRLGRWLNQNLDGVYKFKIGVNTCDIYLVVYYQYEMMGERPGDPKRMSDLYEMKLNINITTYSNKIRVNLIELSPEERTLGHFVINDDLAQDIAVCRKYVLEKVQSILHKVFEGYEFIF